MSQISLLDLGAADPEAPGWERVDPRPWTKTAARWKHPSGWELHHCGHPTANYPWALYAPDGLMVRTGALHGDPGAGTAWRTLADAQAFVAEALSGARPWPPPIDTRMGSVERDLARRKAGT